MAGALLLLCSGFINKVQFGSARLTAFAVCLLFSIVFPCSVFAATPQTIQASYDVYRDGLKVALIEEVYTRNEDRYTLSSTAIPVGLLAVLKPEKVFIRSAGSIGKEGLQPLRFDHLRENDTRKETHAEFDWANRQITLIHDAQRTVLALPEGTQDRLSTMYQFMFLPLQDITTLFFPMTNGKKLDNYHYAITHDQTIKTPAGEFRATYLDSQARTGGSHTEIWLATQHHNLVCKMIVTESGGDQFIQVLNKLVIK